MRILLVYPTHSDDDGAPVKYRKASLPPLALAALAGLTPPEHDVRIVNDICEDVPFDGDWDLVGITSMTAQADRAYQIADEFRERGVPVAMGGTHPSMLPEDALGHADTIAIGEADDLWPEMLVDVENGRLQPVYQAEEYPDLTNCTLPSWEHADLGAYARRPGTKLPMMTIHTTRGCPNACKFCTVTRIYGRKHRMKPVEKVLQEIDETGAEDYFFVDDNILGQPDYAEELFHALKTRNIRWQSQASTTIIKRPDLVELAGEAGCFSLFLGIESLNPDSLKRVSKQFNHPEDYGELFGLLRSAGIIPWTSFIFGFDEDGPEQARETAEFVRKWNLPFPVFWFLTPLPGTPMYDEFEEAGRMRDVPWAHFDGTHIVYDSKTPRDELMEAYWQCFRDSYSLRNSLAAVATSVRHARTKGEELLRSGFLQFMFRSKVIRGLHPYSGGVDRVD